MSDKRDFSEKIKKGLIENIDIIAETVAKGRDVEIRRSKDGVTIAEKTIRIISK